MCHRRSPHPRRRRESRRRRRAMCRIVKFDVTPAQRLVIEWTGKDARGPSEIGLWGFASPRHGVADPELADRVLSDAVPGAMVAPATPNEGHVARVVLGSNAANEPAVFHAT